MSARHYSNSSPPTTLTSDVNTSATSLPVASIANYPTAPFTICVDRGTSSEEVMLCTALGGSAFTVTRGYDGTTAKSHLTGASVEHTSSKIDYEEANAHINDATIHETIPAGSIMAFAGSVSPSGWLLCAGQNLLRATYPDLFTAIGTTYGSVDGTHFNLPDLRGRVIIGMDSLNGSSANRITDVAADVMGGSGGTESVTLSTAQMPSHTHVQDAHNHVHNAHSHGITDPQHRHAVDGDLTNRYVVSVPTPASQNLPAGSASGGGVNVSFSDTDPASTGVTVNAATSTQNNQTATNQATGGGGSHPNTQPWLALSYIIKT